MGLLGDVVKTADPAELRDVLRAPLANVVNRSLDKWRDSGPRWRRLATYFGRDDAQEFAETMLEEAIQEARNL